MVVEAQGIYCIYIYIYIFIYIYIPNMAIFKKEMAVSKASFFLVSDVQKKMKICNFV